MHDPSFENVTPRFPLPSLDEQADIAEKHGIDTLLVCRDPWAVRHFFLNRDTGEVARARWDCLYCGLRKVDQWRQLVKAAEPTLFITLSKAGKTVEEAARALTTFFQYLRRGSKGRGPNHIGARLAYLLEYFAVLERHLDFDENGFHWHLLVKGVDFIPHEVLKEAWRSARHGVAYVVDVRAVRKPHVVGYVTKYLTKSLTRGEKGVRSEEREKTVVGLDEDGHVTEERHTYTVELTSKARRIRYSRHFFPECARLHEKRAEVLTYLERYQEALDACNRAIQLDATCASAYAQKGEILHQVKRLKEALAAFDLAISLDPDASTHYKQKAKVLADVRRYDEALAAYDQAVQLDPYDVFLCKDKSELLVQIGRDEDAPIVFDQFIERTPESFHGYTWKLLFLSEHKRYADGLATCDQSIALHPQWAQPYQWRGRMLWYLHRYDEVLASYEEAFRLDPQGEESLIEQARTLASLKRFDEALAVCERAIQLAPTKPSVYKEKGDILTKQKRHEDALYTYQKAVQFAPRDAFAYEQVGDTLSELERLAEAVKAYDRALRLMPDFTRVYESKAQALEKLGRYEQALAAYNKVLELEPKHFSLLVGRAGVLKKLLRYEEANADYQRAELSAPEPWYAIVCLFGKVDLKEVAEAKARLHAAGKEFSDEAIQAEIRLMYAEKRLAELKASPLFGTICLLMQEKQEWSGTPKQFKEILCSQSPDAFVTWYRVPRKFVEELKKIAPALQEEGIAVSIPPETTLVTLTRAVMERLQYSG